MGGRLAIGGPFYLGPLYSREFLGEALTVCKRESFAEEEEHGERENTEGNASTKKNQAPAVYITQWRKIEGMFLAQSQELFDVALHYNLAALCSSLKLECMPSNLFRGIL